ncbi:MAG: DUF2914 domain-containing protein [Endomicrobia bacterium]|nr:DUF2914 domain-containing protein [Endomicrobiia bacterium]MCL2506874.1 DUF2914 domain-containing protein [Endomicrobiia bacterium]
MKKFGLALVFMFAAVAGSYVFANTLTVVDSAFTTAIVDRQPESRATEFSKNVEKIYYWTKIEGAKEATTVKHIWYSGDKVIHEMALKVTTPSFRTWSNKTLYPGLSDLAVEVVDADGKVLKRDTFTIK